MVHADIADPRMASFGNALSISAALRIDGRRCRRKNQARQFIPFLAIDIDLRQPFLAGVGLLVRSPRRSSSCGSPQEGRTSAIEPGATR